jgi:hypothetical protein
MLTIERLAACRAIDRYETGRDQDRHLMLPTIALITAVQLSYWLATAVIRWFIKDAEARFFAFRLR